MWAEPSKATGMGAQGLRGPVPTPCIEEVGHRVEGDYSADFRFKFYWVLDIVETSYHSVTTDFSLLEWVCVSYACSTTVF